MNHIFFIHSSVAEHLCWLCILTIVNSAAIDMCGQKPLCYSGSEFFWSTPKRGVAGTRGSSIFSFGETSILILIATALVCYEQDSPRHARIDTHTHTHAHTRSSHTHVTHTSPASAISLLEASHSAWDGMEDPSMVSICTHGTESAVPTFCGCGWSITNTNTSQHHCLLHLDAASVFLKQHQHQGQPAKTDTHTWNSVCLSFWRELPSQDSEPNANPCLYASALLRDDDCVCVRLF